jgi:micrococcal nuclease
MTRIPLKVVRRLVRGSGQTAAIRMTLAAALVVAVAGARCIGNREVALADPGAGDPDACMVQRIVDGDTFACADGRRVRLLLVDAPERSQAPFGAQATAALTRLLPPGTRTRLELDVQPTDRYKRVLAYAYTADGRRVNDEMARQGYVLVSVYPPNVRYVDEIRAAVAEARTRRAGLWATDGFSCSPADRRAKRC